MLKNFWFQAHWLAGITAGVVLAVVGLTGGILSFETEIQAWLNRDVRRIEPVTSAPLAPASLLDEIRKQRPDDRVASLALSADPRETSRVTFAPKRDAAGAGGEGQGPRRGGPRGETRFVNPYTGAIIEGEANKGQGFFRTTRSLHRWLVAGEIGNQQVGKQLVGASTLLCVMLALSGLYLRWPRRITNWRSWLTFDPALKGRSFLWHLHAVIGTWVLVVFLLMSVTGLSYSYGWFRNGLYAIAGVERPAPRGEGRGGEGAAGRERPGGAEGMRAAGGEGMRAGGAEGMRAAGGAGMRPGGGEEGGSRRGGGERAAGGEGAFARGGGERAAGEGGAFARGGAEQAGGERRRGEGGNFGGGERGERSGRSAPVVDLDAIWRTFQQTTAQTSFSTVTLTLPQQPGRPVEIRYLDANPAHERANNTLELDARTAAVVKHERYDDKRTGEKFMSSIFPLHSGSFFGMTGIFVYMLASLSMPVFTITGWMMYLDRRKKKRAANAARSAAAATAITAPSAAAGAEKLLLAFASQAGFARELAWQTAGSLQAAGFSVDVQPLAEVQPDRLKEAKRAIFVVSTFGEGEPPDQVRAFARRMMRESLPLQQMQFGLLALGDRQYKTFCEFGRTLDGWLRRQGAKPAFPLIEVDNGDLGALTRWREGVGQFVGGPLTPWAEASYENWTLKSRRVLNPGSAGAPTYEIELTAPQGSATSWQAGDIVEILPGPEGTSVPKREFSIASIMEEGFLRLVIRQVRKPDGTLGMASEWLTERTQIGDKIRLRVRSNPGFYAPTDARGVILIGNGTGIAGLRSLLKHRVAKGHTRNWLMFGERNAEHDSYYRDEIDGWLSAGSVAHVDRTFSRDQADKIYVQHRLMEQARQIREWVAAGAAIYVCGSADTMAPAVDAALRRILGDGLVSSLIEEGSYRRDVY